MKITINTDILQKEGLSLGDFLIMLMGFHEINYEKNFNKLVEAKLIQPNLFNKMSVVLSNNNKDYVAKLLTESDERIIKSGIDFTRLAQQLQNIYPEGNKPGTSYSWRDKTEVIAQKLRILIAKHNFYFTEEEAINATKEYIHSFDDPKYMQLLKYFILKTYQDNTGTPQINSPFMTIIENNR